MTNKTSRPCCRCGDRRQGGDFRYRRRGLAYCDKCATGSPTWIIGPSFYRAGTAVVEGFRGPLSDNPTTQHV